MRINPAARHSETKYGFIVLTGDMIFEHFFVAVELLFRHEHLSSAAADNHQNQLTCHVLETKLRGGRLAHRSTDEASSSFPLALRISLLTAALLAALVWILRLLARRMIRVLAGLSGPIALSILLTILVLGSFCLSSNI